MNKFLLVLGCSAIFSILDGAELLKKVIWEHTRQELNALPFNKRAEAAWRLFRGVL